MTIVRIVPQPYTTLAKINHAGRLQFELETDGWEVNPTTITIIDRSLVETVNVVVRDEKHVSILLLKYAHRIKSFEIIYDPA